MQRPQSTEHNTYFLKYISLIPEGDYFDLLMQNTEEVVSTFMNISEDKQNYQYATGKWTPKQMLMHLMDMERGMSYRALIAARGDSEHLIQTMDEDLYAANAVVDNRSMNDLLEEFAAIRFATRKLFEGMTEEQTTWTANVTNGRVSARALGYMMIGHAIHHMNVLKERYL